MKYYDELKSFITIYGIQEKLENIYYIDETNIALEHNPPKVVYRKIHQAITSARAQKVAFIGCGNRQGISYHLVYSQGRGGILYSLKEHHALMQRVMSYRPQRDKTCLWGFRQNEFQTSLLSYRD